MSATVLYTPEVLALATGLSRFPLDDTVPERADARSRSCGSSITLGLSRNADGVIERVGVRSQACAIGQAAAAIFASAAPGMSPGQILKSRSEIAAWLQDGGESPDWPNFGAIALVRDYPGRHGAVMLPWTAASQLLSTTNARR